MTFLQLCVRFREEADISGTGPTTVLNQNGQLKNIVNWIQQAWVDIQNKRPDWLFMIKEFTFDTVVNQRDYVADDLSITDLKLWDLDSFFAYEKSIGETDQAIIHKLHYTYWKDIYRSQMNVRPSGRVQYLTRLPNNTIRFEPKPDKIYTIDGEYKRSTQMFTADADVPTNLPDDFHMIIVWQALKNYASSHSAPEIMDEADTNFGILINRLEIEQLPIMLDDRDPLA